MSVTCAPPLRDRTAASSFVCDQAEAFLAYFSRLGTADLDAAFLYWAESKDFWPNDRHAIEREVRRLLSSGSEEAHR